MRRRTVFLAVAALTLAACGSSGGGDASSVEGQKYVDAISVKVKSGSGNPFSDTQARCVAGKMVDAIGVGTLKEAGVTPANIAADSSGSTFDTVGKKLTEEQAGALADAITDGSCFDFTDVVVKGLVKSDASFRRLGTTKGRCFFDALLSDSGFKRAMVNEILGRAKGSDAFTKALSNRSKIFAILADCHIRPSELKG